MRVHVLRTVDGIAIETHETLHDSLVEDYLKTEHMKPGVILDVTCEPV